MQTEIKRTLDLWRSNANTIIKAVQNDSGARCIIARITAEGYDFIIPDNATVMLAVKKPDGFETLTEGSFCGSTVCVILTSQTLAVTGLCDAQIKIIFEENETIKKITTPRFKLEVSSEIATDEEITSTEEYSALITALTSINNKVDKIEGKGLSSNDFTDVEKQKLSQLQNITVDDELDEDSENPVSNSVITEILQNISQALENYKSPYVPVILASTTLEEETSEFVVDTYNGETFYCNRFTVQLDIPSTSAASRVEVSMKRANGTYQTLNSEASFLRTVTDSTKHTLVETNAELHSNVYANVLYGGQQPALNVTWNNNYQNSAVYSRTIEIQQFPQNGTQTIKVKLSGGNSLPIGTVIKIWGEILMNSEINMAELIDSEAEI